MNRSLPALFFAMLPYLPTASAQTVSIHVYDFANLPNGTLHSALLEAARIFKAAGIQLAWRSDLPLPSDWRLDMSASNAAYMDTRPYLTLSIVSTLPDTAYPGALGFALPFARTGPHATVVYNRIKAAAQHGPSLPVALGDVIAHELGHDLLHSTDHSQAGLMKAHWDRATWQFAKQGLLSFLPAERATIRDNANRRSSLMPVSHPLESISDSQHQGLAVSWANDLQGDR